MKRSKVSVNPYEYYKKNNISDPYEMNESSYEQAINYILYLRKENHKKN